MVWPLYSFSDEVFPSLSVLTCGIIAEFRLSCGLLCIVGVGYKMCLQVCGLWVIEDNNCRLQEGFCVFMLVNMILTYNEQYYLNL